MTKRKREDIYIVKYRELFVRGRERVQGWVQRPGFITAPLLSPNSAVNDDKLAL